MFLDSLQVLNSHITLSLGEAFYHFWLKKHPTLLDDLWLPQLYSPLSSPILQQSSISTQKVMAYIFSIKYCIFSQQPTKQEFISVHSITDYQENFKGMEFMFTMLNVSWEKAEKLNKIRGLDAWSLNYLLENAGFICASVSSLLR